MAKNSEPQKKTSKTIKHIEVQVKKTTPLIRHITIEKNHHPDDQVQEKTTVQIAYEKKVSDQKASREAKEAARVVQTGIVKDKVNRSAIRVKESVREKLQDDISELNKPLQDLLLKGYQEGAISEDEILNEIDDMDSKLKMLEKFYELADKLSVKIETIEELLERDLKEHQQSSTQLGKVLLYDKKYTTNDKQYKDHIKLYFNDISKIPLLNAEDEKAVAMRVKRGDDNAKKKLIESNLRLVISIAKRFF